jgi:hypothetical protein
MVFSNLDGTLRMGNGALDAAISAGKGDEAKGLFAKLFYKSKSVIEEIDSRSLSSKIDELDSMYYSILRSGAELLRGKPISIANDIRQQPTPQFSKILQIAKDEGPLEIGTMTDESFAKMFIEKNSLSDYCSLVSSNKLETKDGHYTGNIERYSGFRGKAYNGGSVFATSIVDVLPCVKAYPKNNIYIVNGDNEYVNVENHILEKTLNKIGIPSKDLHFL